MTEGAQGRQRPFPKEFEDAFAVGPEPGNNAFFGLNVLQGLVDGIEDFINERQPRWRPAVRLLGPALLGSSVWIEDGGLIDKISHLHAASIVVKKQSRKPSGVAKLARLTALNKQTPGMPIQAFSALSGLAPKIDGKAVTVDPHDAYPHEVSIPTIRTFGLRQGDNNNPPRRSCMRSWLSSVICGGTTKVRRAMLRTSSVSMPGGFGFLRRTSRARRAETSSSATGQKSRP
jgi:hypothetical protein